MRQSLKAILFIIIAASLILMMKPSPSIAGDIILSHNRGSESAVFFIENEPSLVINGFDLTPHTVQFPVALDAVGISVNRAAPGANIELAVYQDANGGSPADATLVHRQPVAINRAGFHRFLLNQAAVITEPVVWVGFYLPPGFRFNADTSGSSVLTYWAWAPGAAFDITSLDRAPVLGPGDGTDPVGIDMQGIARITAELRPLFHQEMESGALLGQQLAAQGEQDTSLMQTYPHCGGLLQDPDDINITSGSSFAIHCGLATEFEAPIEVVNPDDRLLDLQRAGRLYKLDARIPQEQLVHGAVNTLPVPVTHCISIPPGDLERAVIAEARGIPERWRVLPSVRFDDMVCAEITTASYLSYFLPRTASSPPNVNLTLGWTVVDPHPIECGLPAFIRIPAINTGQSWFSTASGYVKFIVEDIHVRSGSLITASEIQIETGQLGPGVRHMVVIGPLYVTNYVNELHRLRVRVDPDGQVAESNEDDNVWFTEYILSNAQDSDRCFDTAWLTATPSDLASVEDFCFVKHARTRGGDRIVVPYSPACETKIERGPVSGSVTTYENFDRRGCTIRVQVEVVGQAATMRYQVVDRCSGSIRHYRDRSRYELIIDHDRPPPPPPTPDMSVPVPTLRRPSVPDAITEEVTFVWNSVQRSGSTYEMEYRRQGESTWEKERSSSTHVKVRITRAERIHQYEWRVRAIVGDKIGPWSELGPWPPTTP